MLSNGSPLSVKPEEVRSKAERPWIPPLSDIASNEKEPELGPNIERFAVCDFGVLFNVLDDHSGDVE
jgi:hypothetical protein